MACDSDFSGEDEISEFTAETGYEKPRRRAGRLRLFKCEGEIIWRCARFCQLCSLMSNLARFPISVGAVRHPRSGFESIPRDISKAELLRYFTYSENDLQEINLCRGSNNRIGFALLLIGDDRGGQARFFRIEILVPIIGADETNV